MPDDRFAPHLAKIWPVKLAALVRFLIDCRAAFDGDLDSALIMATIAERTIDVSDFDHKRGRDAFFAAPCRLEHSFLAVNVQSISGFTGIPRETVRRKVDTLIAKGWVARSPNGVLLATHKAKTDLRDLNDASFEFIAKLDQAFKRAD